MRRRDGETNLHVIHQQTVKQISISIAKIRQVSVLVDSIRLLVDLLEACIFTVSISISSI